MPEKLPAALLPKLRTALASGKIPDSGEPGYDDVMDAWGELAYLFDRAWSKPKESAARRHVSALCDFWSNICNDGLTIGVAINEPELTAAAQEAAAAMKLKVAPPVLAQVAQCIPEELRTLDDVEARLAWYESSKGEPLAEKLDELEERIDEADFATELMEACFRRILAEPNEFFKS